MIGDKSNTPLVSVIMPFFNAEKFLGEAIESVLAQTYENWELLLMDDGSHDGSTALAQRYAELHPRARYLEHDGHQNRGVCAARNLGVRHAKGEYLAFLDGDDVWLPRKLAEQVAILDRERAAGMVFGNPIYWRSWTGRAEDADHVPGLGAPADTLVMPPRLLTALYPLGRGNAPCPSDILLRRGVVEKVGGFEEEFHRKYQLFEDQAFLSKVYLKHPVFVAGQSWLRYRIHPDSVDSVVAGAGEYHTVRRYYLNWLENYLSLQGTPSPEVRRALDAALWPYRHPLRQQMKMSARGFLGKVKGGVKGGARRVLPVSARRWLRARRHGPDYCPPVGWVDFGNLRRVKPFSQVWGLDRGQPVDRYYIEQFLAAHAGNVQGCVLEISDDVYTRRFGGDRITKSDVLHPVAGNPKATMVADLASGEGIPSDAFDCVICTQTLLVIYDVRAVINTLHRILKPGGVLLVTIPGVSHQISRKDMDQWGDYWRFTSLSARRLFEERFPSENVTIKTKGNVLTAAAFLYGLAAEELTREELDYNDPDYEVSIAVRAVKRG